MPDPAPINAAAACAAHSHDARSEMPCAHAADVYCCVYGGARNCRDVGERGACNCARATCRDSKPGRICMRRGGERDDGKGVCKCDCSLNRERLRAVTGRTFRGFRWPVLDVVRCDFLAFFFFFIRWCWVVEICEIIDGIVFSFIV